MAGFFRGVSASGGGRVSAHRLGGDIELGALSFTWMVGLNETQKARLR
jgi:hypothetical protein